MPLVGLVGRKTRSRLAPSGGVERPRRMVRFARLIQRRVRAFWRTYGPRRLRRHLKPDVVTTRGGSAGTMLDVLWHVLLCRAELDVRAIAQWL
jgi:hypothetical protein